MSDGKCGTHTYPNIDQNRINAILQALRQSGSTVTGNNPWNVDTHNNGVKLQGSWNQATSVLAIIVTDKNWYVPCGKIWDTIDPLIRNVQQLAASELPALSADDADLAAPMAAALAAAPADLAAPQANDGMCGRRNYDRVDEKKLAAIIKALRDNRAVVTGNNPWNVDTQKHGVKLQARWSPNTLSVIVTGKNFYVPCGEVWKNIDELMGHIQALDAADVP